MFFIPLKSFLNLGAINYFAGPLSKVDSYNYFLDSPDIKCAMFSLYKILRYIFDYNLITDHSISINSLNKE